MNLTEFIHIWSFDNRYFKVYLQHSHALHHAKAFQINQERGQGGSGTNSDHNKHCPREST